MIIIRRLLVLLLVTICCGMVANAYSNKSSSVRITYIFYGAGEINSSAPIYIVDYEKV